LQAKFLIYFKKQEQQSMSTTLKKILRVSETGSEYSESSSTG